MPTTAHREKVPSSQPRPDIMARWGQSIRWPGHGDAHWKLAPKSPINLVPDLVTNQELGKDRIMIYLGKGTDRTPV